MYIAMCQGSTLFWDNTDCWNWSSQSFIVWGCYGKDFEKCLSVLDQYQNVIQLRCRLKWMILYCKSTLGWAGGSSPSWGIKHRADVGHVRTVLIRAWRSRLSECQDAHTKADTLTQYTVSLITEANSLPLPLSSPRLASSPVASQPWSTIMCVTQPRSFSFSCHQALLRAHSPV